MSRLGGCAVSQQQLPPLLSPIPANNQHTQKEFTERHEVNNFVGLLALVLSLLLALSLVFVPLPLSLLIKGQSFSKKAKMNQCYDDLNQAVYDS